MTDRPADRPNPPADAPPGLLAGIEIGGTKLQAVLAASPTAVVRRWRATADRAGGAAAIRRQIADGLRELSAGDRVAAVGVGFGGPIDVDAGQTCKSHQVAGWEQFDLRDWAEDLAGAPAAVGNDANVAALGEATHGAARGLDPAFYANFGSGVGGGLVTGGRIYRGDPPGEAEFGHLRLDRAGTIVEDRCSGWAVDRRIRETVAEHPRSDLARRIAAATMPGGDAPAGGEARHLAAAVAAGDAVARRVLDEVAGDVAFALSHVVHLFHPRVIVLGGGLSLVGEPLRAAVEAALGPVVMAAFHPPPPVRLAGLGENAVTVGALELAARLAGR